MRPSSSLLKRKLAFALLLSFVAFFLLTVLLGSVEKLPFDNETTHTFNEGWQLLTENEPYAKPVTLPYREPAAAGVPVVIERTLPHDMPGPTVLCFRSSQQKVRVVFNGAEIYSFGHKEGQPFGKSPGSVWNLVRLPEGCADGSVSIELVSPYAAYSAILPEIRVGTKGALIFYLIQTYSFSFTLTVLIFLAGVVMIGIHLLLIRKNEKSRDIYYLGWFSVLVAIWLFGESRMVQFFTGNAYFFFCVTFMAMAAAPIAAFKFVAEAQDYPYGRILDGMNLLLYLELTVVVALQFFGIADFVEVMSITHVTLIATACLAIGTLSYDWLHNHNPHVKPLLFSLLPLIFACGMEIVSIYYHDSPATGGLIRIGMLIFILIHIHQSILRALKIIRLSRMASVDALTGCQNRTAYIHRLTELDGRRDVSVVMADLNDLKVINDTQGHTVGDEALVRCAQCFTRAFAPHGDCYRIGGDEFVFLGSGLPPTTLREMADRFAQILKEEQLQCAYPFHVAYGCTLYSARRDQTLSDTVRRADRIMYRNKRLLKSATAMPVR